MNDFSNTDFRAAFLVLLGGMVTHKGINLADESAYRATCNNIEGLAVQAAKVLAKYPAGLVPSGKIPAGKRGIDLTEDGGL